MAIHSAIHKCNFVGREVRPEAGIMFAPRLSSATVTGRAISERRRPGQYLSGALTPRQ